MKSLLKKSVRALLVIGALIMLMCMPVSAKTASSVKAVKVGKTFTIKNTSKVTSSKKKVAQTKQKNAKAWKVSGLKKGKSTLKVYDKNGKLSQKVYLLVYNGKTFNYDTTAITLTAGDSKKVAASTNISGVTVKYSSTDKTVATVNANGKITAKGKGTAVIKAVFYYKGEKVKTQKKNVTVKNATSTSSSSSKSTNSSGSSSKSSTGSNGSSSSSSSSSAEFTYHTDGKSTRISEGDTMTFTIYCQYASDTVEFKTTNSCLKVIDIETGKCYDSTNKTDCYYHTATVYAYDDGSANVEIYLNGKLFKTYYEQINYSAEYDQEYLAYESWKADMKEILWSDDINWSDDPEMRDLQKLCVFNANVYRKFGYNFNAGQAYSASRFCFSMGYGGTCWAYCDLMEDLAKDLGYEAIDIRTIEGESTHYEAGVWINGHCYIFCYGGGSYVNNFTYSDFKNYNGEYLTDHVLCQDEIYEGLPSDVMDIL